MSLQITSPSTGASRETVCALADLYPERGVAAIVGDHQIALFRLGDEQVVAVQQRDPYSGANVMARGIVGSRGRRPSVASPMYKQVFDLTSGVCLDQVGREPLPGLDRNLAVYPVDIVDGMVVVGADGRHPGRPTASTGA